MAKELPFFKFEISEWMFGRIQKHSEDLQGMFINICCKYWHKLGEYSYEDVCLDFQEERVKKLIEAKIINLDSDYIFIKFLDIQLDERSDHSKKQSIKGLKSADARRKRQQQLTTVEPRLKTVEPNPTEEKRREKNRKEESEALTLEQVKDYLFTDIVFIDAIKMQHKDKNFERAIVECYLYHVQNNKNLTVSEWKQKFISWLSRSKPENTSDGPILYGVSNLKPWN